MLRNQTKKTSKKVWNLGQKSQYFPKILEIDLDFFRLLRPKNKLSQFDHKIRAKSIEDEFSDVINPWYHAIDS